MNFLLGTGGPVRPNLPPHLMDEGERAAALVEKATSDILLQVCALGVCLLYGCNEARNSLRPFFSAPPA